MAPLAKVFVVFALAMFASALTSPHISHNIHQHRALGLQKPTPEPARPVSAFRRERSLNKRCSSKPSTNGTAVAATSASATPSAVPVNVAPNPATSSSSPSPSPTPAQEKDNTPTSSPTPTSTPAVLEKTTPTPTTTSSAAAATSSTSDSSSYPSWMVGTQSGQGTYYETGLGACGITNTDSQLIAAVSWELFDAYPGYDGVNPNTNPVCGKQVTASYQGKSTTVTITDRCTGCSLTDLDFSPTAFSDLASESVGRIDISWVWS
ncbi:RlpA-like double-psi beta-barrel-protein domain-containing protein-containing protein [Pisolithus orientalis]|uniref:RlpA-like double-psi beta-barrel-protein domain-containing protein-containing protein n=1 Tax=Pisolithus orientalis TaxID=936130 RepID=UPI0022248F3F|nr:RlpA-like double-psi beta-barrel-protein domain-containing protein-containing protein [Pisolithus orientalis]KAI6005301.1 RlpA-like double-psi beta-barrel-protein domain-containing protein-containing protein [Pisolithus orientalis]